MGDNVLYMRSSSPFGPESSPYSDRAIDDIRAFVSLNEAVIQSAITAIASAPAFLSKDELVELLETVLPVEEARLVSRVVRWLYRGQKDGPGFEKISRQLGKLESDDEPPKQYFSSDDLRVFVDRATRVSQSWAALERQQKAEDIGKATGQRLQSLQLICDMRPIFNADRTHMDGLIPVTTMRLSVEGADGLPNGVDVVLSESDVDTLVEQLASAKSKLVAIRNAASKLNTPIPTTDLTRSAKESKHVN